MSDIECIDEHSYIIHREPDGDGLCVRLLRAIGIGGAATKEPVRRTGAKRTTAKPGPKASPKQP